MLKHLMNDPSNSFLLQPKNSCREFSRTNGLMPFHDGKSFGRILGYLLGILALCFLFAKSAEGATYYIDFAGGSDSNNGTSKSTPWKRNPFMASFTGSYTHQAGDRFIFKGGVTWDKTCFGPSGRYNITAGGTASAINTFHKPSDYTGNDYHGVDKTWFTGSSWTRPIFDIGGSSQPNGGPITINANWVTFDNIEITNQYITAALSSQYGIATIGLPNSATGVLIQNCYFHNWSHDTFANGTDDGLTIIFCLGAVSSTAVGCLVDSCTFDGRPKGADSGCCIHNLMQATNCVMGNCSNGWLGGSENSQFPAWIDHCTIGPINPSFNPGTHENSWETTGVTYSPGHFFTNNIVFNPTGVSSLIGPQPGPYYIWNNIFYNETAGPPIGLDGRGGRSDQTCYVFNNTFVGDANPVADNSKPNWGTLIAKNNHFIGANLSKSNINNLTSSNNLVQTVAQAAAAGYTQANLYKPTSSSSPTVHHGLNLSTYFATDRLRVKRPQGPAWDIGAYEYAATSPVAGRPKSPTNLRVAPTP
jgi:hypothetical protein